MCDRQPSQPSFLFSLLMKMSSTRKRKCPYFKSQTNIPAEQDEVVTRIEVTRSAGQRIRTTAIKVSIPITEVPSQQHLPPPTSELESSTFNVSPQPAQKKTRKGPSRSIVVSTSHSCSCCTVVNDYVYRITLNNGPSMKRSLPTNS